MTCQAATYVEVLVHDERPWGGPSIVPRRVCCDLPEGHDGNHFGDAGGIGYTWAPVARCCDRAEGHEGPCIVGEGEWTVTRRGAPG